MEENVIKVNWGKIKESSNTRQGVCMLFITQ